MKTANKVLKYVFAFGFAILWIFPVIWLIISSFKVDQNYLIIR